MLLATSRIQNPNTNTAIALGRLASVSPNSPPMSAAYPINKTAIQIAAAPATINGLRRPNRLVQRSLRWPTSGWTTRPERGPHSQMILAQACGIPSSWTYGVRRESWRAHPNCIPPATDATFSSFLNGTLARLGVRAGALDDDARPLDRCRSASGIAIPFP